METAIPTISDADTALLGLLCEKAMHPWQLQKVVEERDMRSWTDLSQSTIYKQLRTLEKQGLVECQQEVGDGRVRKVYSVTPTGREALLARLRELLSEPQQLKWRVDLGVYNLHLLPPADVLACLATYHAKLNEGVECYRKLDAYLESCGCPKHHRAVAQRPLYLLEGELRWLADFTRALEAN